MIEFQAFNEKTFRLQKKAIEAEEKESMKLIETLAKGYLDEVRPMADGSYTLDYVEFSCYSDETLVAAIQTIMVYTFLCFVPGVEE